MRGKARGPLARKGQLYCEVYVYKGGVLQKKITRRVIWRGYHLARYEKQWYMCKPIPGAIGTYRIDL